MQSDAKGAEQMRRPQSTALRKLLNAIFKPPWLNAENKPMPIGWDCSPSTGGHYADSTT